MLTGYEAELHSQARRADVDVAEGQFKLIGEQRSGTCSREPIHGAARVTEIIVTEIIVRDRLGGDR
jgi:hypothetical protein